MNLRKKNIHMDYEKNRASVQTTIEDDVNISDTKPDVTSIIFEKGDLYVDDIKVTQDHVLLRGRLVFSILYVSPEGERSLYEMTGTIPFDENVNMDGIRPGDSVDVQDIMEDLSVTMINSRKISVRCLVNLLLHADALTDIAVPNEVEAEEPMEYHQEERKMWEITVMKKDVYRIKEEIEIPKNYPTIAEIIWDEVKVCWVDFRVMNDKITIQGEMSVFFLYQGEEENAPLRYYENVHPFNGTISCSDVREGMIPIINYRVASYELAAKPDYDGEERAVSVDVSLDLDIRVYEEESVPVISDVYGVTKDLCTVNTSAHFKNLISRNTLKQRLVERMKINEDAGKILQLIHSRSSVVLDDVKTVEDAILIAGSVHVNILYISNDDDAPYSSMKGDIPFSYTIDIPDITENCSVSVDPSVEQISVVMVDSEEVDVKLVLNFKTTVFNNEEEELIDSIEAKELDMDKMNELPSMAIYFVQAGDTLWQIGKKYYVPVSRLKELNSLSSDLVQKGDKLLIVR